MPKLAAGDAIAPRTLETIQAGSVAVPDPARLTHLQLRRFAGCPMCNLHLRSFIQRHDELVAAGVAEVVVFHSSREALRRKHAEAPFPLVADPRKRLYAEFGVETSPLSVLHPGAWLPAVKGLFRHGAGLPAWGESPLGLPADVLIDRDGRVVACKYGAHAYDHWTVDDVLERARRARGTAGDGA